MLDMASWAKVLAEINVAKSQASNCSKRIVEDLVTNNLLLIIYGDGLYFLISFRFQIYSNRMVTSPTMLISRTISSIVASSFAIRG